jgi:S1-C subfamily serine protease
MKYTIAVILVFILCAIAHAGRSEGESQAQALKVYPELGVPGSKFNKRFLEAHTELKKRVPSLFENPDWPMLLAGAIDNLRRSSKFFDDPEWPARLTDYLAAAANIIEPTAHFLDTKKKAENGDAEAQLTLATLYGDGKEITRDEAEARKWLLTASENGNAKAQGALGVFLRDGVHGFSKDPTKAVDWLRKAADKGNLTAMEELGLTYDRGDGVPRDSQQAVKWFRTAAEAGFAPAQLSLAACYLFGDGVPKDLLLTYMWANLAAAQGSEQRLVAQKLLTACEGHMTADEIAEAQRLSREFRPRAPGEPSPPPQSIASGTGFFITNDGFVVTNAHVVRGGTKFQLRTRAGTVEGHVVKIDPANDIALLKADGHFAPLPLLSSRDVRLGTTVATVGFPRIDLQGFSPKLSKGEIASLSGAADDARYFQISVPTQHGNSGGALFDERGNVVGIVSAKLGVSTTAVSSDVLPENVNYAVKSSYLLGFLESMPELSANLLPPNTKDAKFEDVVQTAENAAVLVIVY